MTVVCACIAIMLGAFVVAVCSHIAHTRRDAALRRQLRYQLAEPLEPNNLVLLPTQRTSFDAHCRDALTLANERGHQ